MVIGMENFFTFYTEIDHINMPFIAFHFVHFIFMLIIFIVILLLYRWYNKQEKQLQRRFQIGMGIYFMVEELIYTIWLILTCRHSVIMQIIPLELCSLCAYINVGSVFTNNHQLRFFSVVTGMFAGMIALVYPANISGLYPMLSYRVINFYMLHGSFILFSIIMLQDTRLLQRHYLKRHLAFVGILFSFAFIVNTIYHTQYMFVGTPPTISIVHRIYQFTNILFLPTVIVIICLIQCFVYALLCRVYRLKEQYKIS